MNRVLKAFAASAVAIALFSAAPAQATVTLVDEPGVVQPDENVLLPTGQTGLVVFGSTNQTDTSVTFQSLNGDILTTPANGQARIETTEDPSSLDTMMFFLTNGETFTEFEFNLFSSLDTLQSITLMTNLGNIVFDLDGNGQNYFAGVASDGQVFTGISFDASGSGVTDIRQIRIGGIGSPTTPVPEPATWAMMLIGFGAAGTAMRRSRRRNALLTQIA